MNCNIFRIYSLFSFYYFLKFFHFVFLPDSVVVVVVLILIIVYFGFWIFIYLTLNSQIIISLKGSGVIKAGFAGDEDPKCFFPSM